MKFYFASAILLSLTAANSVAAEFTESFVTIDQSGHLSCAGERVRFWGVIGGFPNGSKIERTDTPEVRQEKVQRARLDADATVKRFVDLGFNMCRTFRGAPSTEHYVKGDGSGADVLDYFLSVLKANGIKVWCASINREGTVRPDDVNILKDEPTRELWRAAVEEAQKAGNGKFELRNNVARIWDPRLEAIGMQRMRDVATHTNKYTGLRWCDDPVFAVWELSNEEWWMRRMTAAEWRKLPQFFQMQLISRWNEFLKRKYGSTEKLIARWSKLLPGESLEARKINLLPMAGKVPGAAVANDASKAVEATLQTTEEKYQRDDFAPERASDVLEFFLELQLQHKRREAEMVKSLGKSTALCPLIYDTGIGYEIQSQYLHQSADAVAHDAYVDGWARNLYAKPRGEPATELGRMQRAMSDERLAPNDGPWINWLLKPPGISQGVPWLEHNRVEGKPYLAYETQIQQPAKYRADFPIRIAALASIQDWDAVCWHYFAVSDATAENAFAQPLDITTGDHPQGYHYTFDEVQNAMMLAAGKIFRQNLLPPAPEPTVFVYGRKSLYAPSSMDYAGSYGLNGMQMLQTTYQYGSRIEIDPNREEDEIRGPVVRFEDRNSFNPYTPTPEMTFDWKKGFVRFDSPAVSAFTGLLARYGDSLDFKSGVSVREIKIVNPPGSFDPVGDDERYIAFALYSLDGKPLEKCSRAALSLVSTSFNSGFSINPENMKVKAGGLPVLVSRVGAKLGSEAFNDMEYTFRDWHFNAIGSGKITDGELIIPSDRPVFLVELNREQSR